MGGGCSGGRSSGVERTLSVCAGRELVGVSDPTNRIIAGRNLIRIATTRSPSQALPLSGTFNRGDASFLGMDVQVDVALVT